MVDGIDLPGRHRVNQTTTVAHRTQNRDEVDRQFLRLDPALQFGVNGVKAKLVVFKQHQFGRPGVDNLTAQLAADGATCARHQHHLVANTEIHQLLNRLDRVSAEQVGNIDFLQIVHFDLAAGNVHDPRDTAHMNLEAGQAEEDLLSCCSGGRRNRQQHFLDVGFGDQFGNVLRRVHRQAANHPSGQTRIIINERLGFIHATKPQRGQ